MFYLERFATSSANLRRILMRKVERSAGHHGTDAGEGAAEVEQLIGRFERSGLLDDAAYAQARAKTLHRRGTSARAIRGKLMEKGVGAEHIELALHLLAGGGANADLTAAVTLARRRRLGPWRAPQERKERHDKDLAALARAGFSYDVALRVIEAPSADDLEGETAEGS